MSPKVLPDLHTHTHDIFPTVKTKGQCREEKERWKKNRDEGERYMKM